MDGLGWLIKNALASAGVEIDPKEIVSAIETAKILIPKIALQFDEQKKTLARMEEKLDRILNTPVENGRMLSEFVPIIQKDLL